MLTDLCWLVDWPERPEHVRHLCIRPSLLCICVYLACVCIRVSVYLCIWRYLSMSAIFLCLYSCIFLRRPSPVSRTPASRSHCCLALRRGSQRSCRLLLTYPFTFLPHLLTYLLACLLTGLAAIMSPLTHLPLHLPSSLTYLLTCLLTYWARSDHVASYSLTPSPSFLTYLLTCWLTYLLGPQRSCRPCTRLASAR